MAETRRGHWKVWLTLVLMSCIFGLLLFTDAGRQILDSLKIFKIGQFAKSAATPTDTQFSISLNSGIDPFYSQVYKLTNSSFTSSGICRQVIKLGDWIRQTEDTRCSISLTDFAGTFDFTAGSIKLYGESADIVIDGILWSSSKPEKVEIEVIPESFLLKDLSQQKISFSSITGSIARGEKGSENLNNNSLQIANFIGYLKLENHIAILTGTASSVKSQEFSW